VWNILCAMHTETRASESGTSSEEYQLDDRTKYPKD